MGAMGLTSNEWKQLKGARDKRSGEFRLFAEGVIRLPGDRSGTMRGGGAPPRR